MGGQSNDEVLSDEKPQKGGLKNKGSKGLNSGRKTFKKIV